MIHSAKAISSPKSKSPKRASPTNLPSARTIGKNPVRMRSLVGEKKKDYQLDAKTTVEDDVPSGPPQNCFEDKRVTLGQHLLLQD